MTDPTTTIDTTRLRELLRMTINFRSESMRTAALGVLRKEAARALPALIDQLNAQAAEIEWQKSEIGRFFAMVEPLEKEAAHAWDRVATSEARMAELEAAATKACDAWFRNQACELSVCALMSELDAALAKREGE